MSGMMTQTFLNSGPKGSLVSGTGWRNSTSTVPFQAQTVRIPVSILTYRSGPHYDRAIANGALPYGGSYNDVLTRLQGDNGHEFRLFKTSIPRSYSYGKGGKPAWGTTGLTGSGAQAEHSLSTAQSAFPVYSDIPSWAVSDAALTVAGTEFISESNPLASEADLLVSIAEIMREGLPSILFKEILNSGPGRHSRLRGLGGEYLNFIFGYQPIVSDIVRVYDALSRIDSIVNQWIRDNAREVRRRRRRPRKHDNVSLNFSSYGSSANISLLYRVPHATLGYQTLTGSYNPTGVTDYVRSGFETIKTDLSFSSAFTYDLSKLLVMDIAGGEINESNLALRMDLTLHALGLSPEDLSFDVLWNLTPFSWLVDWFVNIGDLFANARAFQTAGLRTTYAYVTAHQVRSVFWDSQMRIPNGDGSYTDVSQGMVYKQKYVRRLRATPFGFGLKPETLTSSQVSILAALASQALK